MKKISKKIKGIALLSVFAVGSLASVSVSADWFDLLKYLECLQNCPGGICSGMGICEYHAQ